MSVGLFFLGFRSFEFGGNEAKMVYFALSERLESLNLGCVDGTVLD